MTATSTPRQQPSDSEPGLRSAARSGLDVMLTDAVLEDGGVSRFLKPRAAGRTVAGLVRHPRRTARDASGLGMELARVAAGRSAIGPAKGDRRFVDQAWSGNWALVNPPAADSRATYRVTDDIAADAEAWVHAADAKQGSWWPDYRDWLATRSGALKPAPKSLGSRKHRPTAKAPGSYVHAA